MNSLKIALLQIAPCGTLKDNLTKGIEACKKAKEMGADIALFPEMWSNGYQIYDRPVEEWKEEAIPADCDFVNSFGKLAKGKYNLIIAAKDSSGQIVTWGSYFTVK